MKCSRIIFLLCLVPPPLANAHDDTSWQFGIYQKISTVLRDKDSSEGIDNLRAAMEDQAADVYESVGIINWQLQAAGLRCKDHPVPLILNSLNTSVAFRFNYGLVFRCKAKDLIQARRL